MSMRKIFFCMINVFAFFLNITTFASDSGVKQPEDRENSHESRKETEYFPQECDVFVAEFNDISNITKNLIHKINLKTKSITATWTDSGYMKANNGIAARIGKLYSSSYLLNELSLISITGQPFKGILKYNSYDPPVNFTDAGVYVEDESIIATNINYTNYQRRVVKFSFPNSNSNGSLEELASSKAPYLLDTAIVGDKIYVSSLSDIYGINTDLTIVNQTTKQLDLIGNNGDRITGMFGRFDKLYGVTESGKMVEINQSNGSINFLFQLPLTGKAFDLAAVSCKNILPNEVNSCRYYASTYEDGLYGAAGTSNIAQFNLSAGVSNVWKVNGIPGNPINGIGAKNGKFLATIYSGIKQLYLNPNGGVAEVVGTVGNKGGDGGAVTESGDYLIHSYYQHTSFLLDDNFNVSTTIPAYPVANTNPQKYFSMLDGTNHNGTTYMVGVPDVSPNTGASSLFSHNPSNNSLTKIGSNPQRFTGLMSAEGKLIGLSQNGEVHEIDPLNGNSKFIVKLQLPNNASAKWMDLTTYCSENLPE